MAFPRNSLSAFLGYAKRNLNDCLLPEHKINIVAGNESADLDSFTSSLLYAYIRSAAPPKLGFSPVYVPLLNIPRSEVRLRPEFTALCKDAAIQTASLLTHDDLPDGALESDHLRWILVDHNKPAATLGRMPLTHIVGVIDHHEDESFVPTTTNPEPRIIEKVGSCTSLVTRFCRSSWDVISSSSLSIGSAHGQGDDALNDSAFSQAWDARVAKLAIASILIDTNNLTAEDKVEQADREAVEYLEAKIATSPKDAKAWDRKAYYKEINGAKKDIGDFTLEEILTKDYKQWTEKGMNLGISSVVRNLEFLVGKAVESGSDGKGAVFVIETETFMKKRDLAVLAIMTKSKSKNGDFQRELLLQARSGVQDVAFSCAESVEKELELEELSLDSVEMNPRPSAGQVWRNAWLQRKLAASRKQVAPLLRRAMQ